MDLIEQLQRVRMQKQTELEQLSVAKDVVQPASAVSFMRSPFVLGCVGMHMSF